MKKKLVILSLSLIVSFGLVNVIGTSVENQDVNTTQHGWGH